MAASLESVSVPYPSELRNAIPVRAIESPVSALSSIRRVGTLSGFRGLIIQVPYPRRSLTSSSSNDSRLFRRGGRIVCEAQKTVLEVPAVTDVTWKSLVLEADLPVLVEFWASWCGPCSMIHPVIEILSKKYAGKLKCFKLNTDESPSIATQYGIRSIPTVMIFKNGDKKDAVIGAVPETTLIASIEKFL